MSLYKKSKINNWIKYILFLVIIIMLSTILYISNDKSAIVANIKEDIFGVKIIITEKFGESTLISDFLNIEAGETAIDGLEKVASISTSYGGGFVESINGIESTYDSGKGEKNDWFFYINGILSPIGASDYILHPGDIERWDYHYWGLDRKVSAVIADYPEPFLHGFQGQVRKTTIVYSKIFENNTLEVKKSLDQFGVDASVVLFNELSSYDKKNNNLILIDKYDNTLIQELNSNADKLGWFVEFRDNSLIILDILGNEKITSNHGGVLLATQNPWNPKGNWNGENVVWVISGITNKDVIEVVNRLLRNDFENPSSIVIIDQEIYRVP